MKLFEIGFVTVTLVDILDIAIVTFLFYKLYESLKGSMAIRITSAVISVFLVWKVVDLLGFRLLGSILDEFLGIGAIAVVVIFAPEIRRFFTSFTKNTLLERIIRQVSVSPGSDPGDISALYKEVVESLKSLRATGHGALIVLAGKDSLAEVRESGDELDAKVSARLIYTIFVKESPLHDGAMVLLNRRIAAVRCILPISRHPDLDPELGLRHRSGLGISEITDALVIIASEERRELSLAQQGELKRNVDYADIEEAIQLHYQTSLP